ncbi:MAG: GDSL-type esterase/lipase family protein [Eubacteriales bacterium]
MASGMKILEIILCTSVMMCLTSDSVVQQPLMPEEATKISFAISQERMEILPQWFLDFFQLEVAEEKIEEKEEIQITTLDKVEETKPVAEPEVEPEPEPEPVKTVYVYGEAVPEAERVEGDYFADAAMIGDSRSQGLMAFGDLGGGSNFTGLGLSVYNLWDKAYVSVNGVDTTVLKALEKGSYSKVYISLGINSVGYPSVERFYSNYSNFIDEIRARQPEAVIYVQSIIPLNEPILRSRGSASYFNNGIVTTYNTYIQKLAQEKNLYYLDLYNYFLDETGQLPSEASSDGIHLSAAYTKKWAEYLKTHTISEEVYDIQSISQGNQSSGEIYPVEGDTAAS